MVSGTVKELADKYETELQMFVGFLDGINDSLKEANPIEEMDENTQVSLDIDFEKLYYNMVGCRAEWLYNLKEWDDILTEERRKELYKESRNSTTVVKGKKIGRNDPCPCGSGKKYKHCHEAFDEKLMEAADAGHQIPDHDMIKTPEQIEGIRESCKINVAVLDYVAEHIKAGVTTEEIDQWVYNETTRMGGIPAPLGYEGFPKSVCTSINDQVCHGIPSADVVLKDGDIINVDVSTIYHGYYADSSRMFCIGNVSPEHKKLVDVVKECVELGLEQVKPWGFMGDMAEAVQKHAEENGYSVVREIGGHGVGIEFHEDPWVGYIGQRGTGMMFAPGMMFTIEPMINEGTEEVFVDGDDDWSVYTKDGKASAQWEIQVLVTEDGHEVLSW